MIILAKAIGRMHHALLPAWHRRVTVILGDKLLDNKFSRAFVIHYLLEQTFAQHNCQSSGYRQ